MIQLNDVEFLEKSDIKKLLEKIKPILNKRMQLHNKYSRNANDSKVMYSKDNKNTKIPLEKFLVDLATGYLSGEPIYTVSTVEDEEKQILLSKLLDKSIGDTEYKKSIELIIDYITKYNDDIAENKGLIHDLLELTSCYEIMYENNNNEIVYVKYDPLQTVAIWDYQLPSNLIGIVRNWKENSLNGKEVEKIELTDKRGTRTYTVDGDEVIENDNQNHDWGDVPAFAIENDFNLFEICEDMISTFEQLVQNARNTFQYNDSDCKLKIVNYAPQNSLTITNDNGEEVPNPAREIEDNLVLNSRTFYVGEGGDVSWIIKPVDSGGVITLLKTYLDLVFQLVGIPNTSDLAFNGSDLNASAIDRKFYIMDTINNDVVIQLRKAYLRRWEIIFNRINLKKGTKFDFRDIKIDIPKNTPNKLDEKINGLLKLNGIISEQTIIESLGYNYLEEKSKKEIEAEENIIRNMELMKGLDDEMGQNRQNDIELVDDVQKKEQQDQRPIE